MVEIGERVVALTMDGYVTGVVGAIDPRCQNGAPCPCCGLGVSIRPEDPDIRYGVSPDQVWRIGTFPAAGGRA